MEGEGTESSAGDNQEGDTIQMNEQSIENTFYDYISNMPFTNILWSWNLVS